MTRRRYETTTSTSGLLRVRFAVAHVSRTAPAARTLALAICLMPLFGCRTAVLQRPPVVSFAPLPMTDVEAAIYDGCNRRKWIPSKVRDGEIEATLYLRSHVAVVDIEYNADSFHVQYVRSENLNYKQRDGEEVIHPNYNAWVKNLIGDIDAALSERRGTPHTRSARSDG